MFDGPSPWHVFSMSGGKDSTATVLLGLELLDDHAFVRLVFADTGNEHPMTYEYLDKLEGWLGIKIVRLKRDFSDRFARKRKYVLEVWPTKDVPPDVCERAAAALQPSGNPYLDLCLLKGRFPSRMAQFCTQELKTVPLVEYQMDLIDDTGRGVWSWQGVRGEESPRRALYPEFEEIGGGLYAIRPILRWVWASVFEAHAAAGIEPNPLYKLGMTRVGCMPCINASKAEIAQIAQRFPEVINRIEEWEHCVAAATKRGLASFFPAPDDGRGDLRGRDIRTYVQWARTTHGGKQLNLMTAGEAPECSSSYGLCE